MAKTFQWASCQNANSLVPVSSRAALLASGGNNYFADTAADGSACLHLKITDPGHPWKLSDSFVRDGMAIEETVCDGPHDCGGLVPACPDGWSAHACTNKHINAALPAICACRSAGMICATSSPPTWPAQTHGSARCRCVVPRP